MEKITCRVLGCEHAARSKGLCAYHYEKSRKDKLGVRCSKEGCEGIAFAAGLCGRHYQAKRNGYVKENGKAAGRKCAYPGCSEETVARKYCRKHYMRKYRHGEVVPDGYRRTGKSRHCLYCYMRVLDGTQLCGEHKGWKTDCVICGYERIVEAAHVLPRASGAPKEEWNMMPLCPNHHRLYDHGELDSEEMKKIQPYIDGAKLMLSELTALSCEGTERGKE